MRKYLSQLWIMLLLMLVSINSFATDPLWQVLPDSIEKSESDPRDYQAIKLANDMTVLLVSDKKSGQIINSRCSACRCIRRSR